MQAKRRAAFLSGCSARIDAAFRITPSPQHDALTATEWARAFHGLPNEIIERAVSDAIDAADQYPPRLAQVLALAVRRYVTDELSEEVPDRMRFLEDIEDRRRRGERADHCFGDHPVYGRALKVGGHGLWSEDAIRAGSCRKAATEAFDELLTAWLLEQRREARKDDMTDWRLVAQASRTGTG